MKNNVRMILLGFVCSLFAVGSWTMAQSTGSSIDAFLSSIIQWFGNFGYRLTNISVDTISPTQVVIKSPVIRDGSSQDVKKYVLWYGPYPFSQLLNGGSGISTADFKSKEFTYTSFSWSTFTMALGTADGLSATQTYYAVVVPIATNGELWELSGPDICFKLQGWLYAEWLACSSLGTWTTHNSAWANMALADISNTCNGNQITLTWTSVPGADKVKIYKVLNNWTPGTLIADKAMSARTHIYTLPNPVAPEVVRFVPTTANGTPSGTEKDYTLRLCNQATTPITPTTPVRPGVPTVPKVGPEQDIAYVLFATLFIYGVVRYARYRRAKH